MGASESKTDDIDVDVDVADAPPPPVSMSMDSMASADDARPATPQAVYRTADAPAEEGVRLEAARARRHGGGRDRVRGARRSAGRRASLSLGTT